MGAARAWASVLLIVSAAACDGGEITDDLGPFPEADGGRAASDGAIGFIVLGDTGTGDAQQRAAADAAHAVCAREGCAFVLLLGDNLYPRGADSIDDPIWQTAFEEPYAAFDIPFYPVLGNHDDGGEFLGITLNGLGNEHERGLTEVAYTSRSSRWKMPSTYHVRREGPVGLIGLDTNTILWDAPPGEEQRAWWPDAYAEVDGAPWVIAYGHHPYRSNGEHGNAGDFDLADGVTVPIPEVQGDHWKAFMDDLVCGQADVYLAGHDHTRQWLDAASMCGGTELIISGAGGKTTPLARAETPTRYEDDSEVGFLHVRADATSFRGRFYDAAGEIDFEYTLTK
jgi:hypothetical protein